MPSNINTYLSSFFGNTSPITEKNFSQEDLNTLLQVINRKAQVNRDRLFSLENMLYDTPSEYRRVPSYSLKEQKDGRYISEEKTYAETQEELKNKIKSYKKNPNKISVSYGDYGIKSGEDAAPVHQNWFGALQQSFTDPAFRLASTLGSFNAYDEGNQYRIEDKYKFNNDQQWYYNNAAQKPLGQILKRYWNQPGKSWGNFV